MLGLGEAAVHAEQGDGVGGRVKAGAALHGLHGPAPRGEAPRCHPGIGPPGGGGGPVSGQGGVVTLTHTRLLTMMP